MLSLDRNEAKTVTGRKSSRKIENPMFEAHLQLACATDALQIGQFYAFCRRQGACI